MEGSQTICNLEQALIWGHDEIYITCGPKLQAKTLKFLQVSNQGFWKKQKSIFSEEDNLKSQLYYPPIKF